MSVIIILVIAGIVVAGGFLLGFIWAVRSGQYDDTYSPSVRLLFDDPTSSTEAPVKDINPNKGTDIEKPKINSITKLD